jgi:hypothetical protein
MRKLSLLDQLNSKDLIQKILGMKPYSQWMRKCIQDGTTICGKMLQTIQHSDTIDSTQELLEVVKSVKLYSQVFRLSKMKMILTLAMPKLPSEKLPLILTLLNTKAL